MGIAVYPGSFDPVTNGHLDIIARAAKIFDELVVAVFHNSEKKPLFSMQERVEMLRRATAEFPNVRVDSFSGLTYQYARSCGAKVITRGLRAFSDFEYEFQMAQMNKKLDPELETVFIMTSSQYSYLSSRVVKEIASYGGCVNGLVPEYVAAKLAEKYRGGCRKDGG